MDMMLSKHVPFEVPFPKRPVITHPTVKLRLFSALEAYVVGQWGSDPVPLSALGTGQW